jgi:DNA-binding NtrC family response regulator
MQGVVLVVDDRIRPRRALAVELEDAGFAVVQAADGAEAWKLFCRHAPDVVITDLVMPRCDGIELLTRIRARSDVPVILFTARGSVQAAATAFKAGADEFVASPDVEVEELVELVTTATGERRATREPPDLARRLVGRSEAATRIRERISGLIPLWTPVLVCGEPGTGHDTVALALHELGASAGGRFTRFEAASFSPRQELPSRGAVYLDGAERLPADGQAFWAERIVKAETSSFQPNLRVLASTTEHLLSRLRDGSYDAQLGTLLLRFAIDLPPLRDRAEDVCDIADALTEKIGRAVGRRIRLSSAARELIAARRWPGNLRQLERLLERAVAFSRGRQIRRRVIEDLCADEERTLLAIREQHAYRERDALLRAIEATGGNISRAAERLGRSRGAVYRLLAKHGIDVPPRS